MSSYDIINHPRNKFHYISDIIIKRECLCRKSNYYGKIIMLSRIMAYLLCLFAVQNNRYYGTNHNDGTGDRLDGR